jgi:hypothetical protein
VQVRFDPATLEALDAWAQEVGATRAEAVRDFVRWALLHSPLPDELVEIKAAYAAGRLPGPGPESQGETVGGAGGGA